MKVIKLMQIKMVEIMKMTMLLMLIKVEAEMKVIVMLVR